MRRTITLATATLFAAGLLTAPALADHPHQLDNPGRCVDIPVGGQDHSGYDDSDGDPRGAGKKFHGAAHVGAATQLDQDGNQRLGQGNSQVTVDGGTCSP